MCRAAVILCGVFGFELSPAPITNFNHSIQAVRARLILFIVLLPPFLYRRVAPFAIAFSVGCRQWAAWITCPDVVCFYPVTEFKGFQAKVAVGGAGFYFRSSFAVIPAVESLLPGFFDFRPPLIAFAICDCLMLWATVSFAQSPTVQAWPVKSHEASGSFDLAIAPRRSSSSFSKHGMQSLIAVRECCFSQSGHMFSPSGRPISLAQSGAAAFSLPVSFD